MPASPCRVGGPVFVSSSRPNADSPLVSSRRVERGEIFQFL